jgi:hypothetical protein
MRREKTRKTKNNEEEKGRREEKRTIPPPLTIAQTAEEDLITGEVGELY